MEKVVSCKQCGSQNPNDAQFCIMCGSSLRQVAIGPTEKLAALPCSSCKALSPSDAHFCVSCGHTLNQAVTSGRHTTIYASPSYAPTPSQMSPQPISRTLPKQSTSTNTSRHSNLGMLLVVGLFLFLIVGISWWWIIPLFLIYHGLFKSHAGISKSNIQALLWFTGIYFLFTTGSFWPIILLLFFLSILLDKLW